MQCQSVRQVRPKWLRLSVRARDKRRRQLPVRKQRGKPSRKCVQANTTHVACESVARNWVLDMSAEQLRRQRREQRQFQRRSGQFVASDETTTLCFLVRYRRHSDSDQQQLAEAAEATARATATVASTTGAATAGATSATVKLRRFVQRQQRPQSTAFEMSNVWAITTTITITTLPTIITIVCL